MKALSVLQPYAWLIVNGHKDVENRGWHTKVRGRILVHVGLKYPRCDHQLYVDEFRKVYGVELPAYSSMPRGGICGEVEIVDCVRAHPSKWKDPGSWGFVLANARPLEFRPYRGQLGFFEVPDVQTVCSRVNGSVGAMPHHAFYQPAKVYPCS